MKTKKLLPIIFLAGSLVLTSCDQLISNFMNNGNSKNNANNSSEVVNDQSNGEGQNDKSDNNYDASNNQGQQSSNGGQGGQSQQGQPGVTELNEAQWNEALSVEAFALRRNCKVVSTQSDGTQSQSYTIDLDNGKAKMDIVSGDEQATAYCSFDSVENGMLSYTIYVDVGGSYMKQTSEEELDAFMVNFGILSLDKKDFTYDKISKSYKAAAVTYTTKYSGQDISISLSEIEITFENALVSKIELDITYSAESAPVHMVTTFTQYGQITVTLPEVGGGADINTGDEITFADFKDAYDKRTAADYNHVEMTASGETVTADYVYGVWQSEDDDLDDETVESFILNDDNVASMEENAADYTFYHDATNNTYGWYYHVEMYGMEMSGSAIYDSHFYVLRQVVNMFGMTIDSSATWSKVDTLPVMLVQGRSFVGVDIQESNFVYYNTMKEVAKGMTINFDEEGCVEFIFTKMDSEGQALDYNAVYYGTYEQQGTNVVCELVAIDMGEGIQFVEEEQIMETTLVINENKIAFEWKTSDDQDQLVDIHMLFEFAERFDEDIEFEPADPDIDDDDDDDDDDGEESLNGTYSYLSFDVVLDDENDEEAEAAAQDAIDKYDVTPLYRTLFVIAEETNMITFVNNGTYFMGNYVQEEGVLNCSFTTTIDPETYETSQIQAQSLTLYLYENGEIAYEVLNGEGYSVRAVFEKI